MKLLYCTYPVEAVMKASRFTTIVKVVFIDANRRIVVVVLKAACENVSRYFIVVLREIPIVGVSKM